MSTLTFDTLRFTERLKAAGVAPAQAIAEAEALHDALSRALATSLAPKSEIAAIRTDIVDVHFDLERLSTRVDARFSLMDAKFDKLAWMLGMVVALNAANFAKQFF